MRYLGDFFCTLWSPMFISRFYYMSVCTSPVLSAQYLKLYNLGHSIASMVLGKIVYNLNLILWKHGASLNSG